MFLTLRKVSGVILDNLVIDGVSIGIKVSSLKGKADLFLPFYGESLVDAETDDRTMLLYRVFLGNDKKYPLRKQG